MSNPDKNSDQGVSSFIISLPVGILFFLISIALFQFKETLPAFKLFIWIGLPAIAFLVVFIVNISTQYTNCGSIESGKAALGALPSIGTTLIGLFISSFAICRIPVASVFTPLIIGNNVDITNNRLNSNSNTLKNSISKECCTKKISIQSVESKYSIIEGISYGFYLMFAIFFGVTIGNGFATIC